jgi:hypothetical protein
MADSENNGESDEIDAEIIEQEKVEKKDNSGFFTLLFSAVMLISLVAWSFTHYMF